MRFFKPLRVVLVIALLFVSFQLYAPTIKSTNAAGYFLGDREVPGPLPPNLWVPWMSLDVQRNINYGVHNGSNQLLDYAKPTLCRDQKVPLVIFVHGGWWVAGSKGNTIYSNIAKMFYQLGFAFASIDYRLSRVADHPETINDCKLAVRYFRAYADEYGIDPDKIGIWGSSAGGHLVSLMGTASDDDGMEGPGLTEYSSRPQAVVNYCGITDLTDPWSPTSIYMMDLFLGCHPQNDCPEKAIEASPVHQASPDDPPIMIMHGDQDPTVAYSQAQSFSKALHNAGNNGAFIEVTNGNHGFGGINVSPDWFTRYFLTVSHLARHIEPELLCDLNMDGHVDVTDRQMLYARLGEVGIPADAVPGPDTWNPLADIHLDGVIDYRDLQEFCIGADPLIHIEKKLVNEDGKKKIFMISVENTGPLDVTGLVITDELPILMDFESSSVDGTLSGKTFTVNLEKLEPYSNFTFYITVKLPSKLTVSKGGMTFTNKVSMISDNTFEIDAEATCKLANLSISQTADKYTVYEGDLIKYKVYVRNQSEKEVNDCTLTYTFPRELEFVTSNPKTTIGSGNISIPIGTINPGQTHYFEFIFRVANIGVSGDGTAMTNTARVFGSEINQLSSASSVVFRTKRVSPELLIDIKWNGIDTKNNTISNGDEVELLLDISGGTSPYKVTVNLGDGEKSFIDSDEKSSASASHVWDSSGEYEVRVIVADMFGKMKNITRVIIVK